MRRENIALLTTICLLTSAVPAYAYVDPGTGAMLLQVITGGVAGLLVLARLYWRRARSVFRSNGAPRRSEPAERSKLG